MKRKTPRRRELTAAELREIIPPTPDTPESVAGSVSANHGGNAGAFWKRRRRLPNGCANRERTPCSPRRQASL